MNLIHNYIRKTDNRFSGESNGSIQSSGLLQYTNDLDLVYYNSDKYYL